MKKYRMIAPLHIAEAERFSGGVLITFSDGRNAFIPALALWEFALSYQVDFPISAFDDETSKLM